MNKLIIVFSFICVLLLHFIAFTFYYQKETIKIQNQEKYSKLTLQLTKLRKVVKKKQEVKKITKKIKQRKESKKSKNIVKNIIKKPPKTEEKVQKKFIQTQQKEIIKQNINKIQSLKKFKQFKDNYASKIRAKIDKNKIYPRTSKRLKEEGSALVSFRVLKNGTFKKIILVKSSSIDRLDKAALNAVINTEKYKAFPKEIKKEFLDFSLVIEFRIL